MAKPTRRQVVNEIWLLYFNRYLLEHGVIDETTYRRMDLKIRIQPAAETKE